MEGAAAKEEAAGNDTVSDENRGAESVIDVMSPASLQQMRRVSRPPSPQYGSHRPRRRSVSRSSASSTRSTAARSLSTGQLPEVRLEIRIGESGK